MTRRFLSSFGSLFLLVSCGSDDKLPAAPGPDATLAPLPKAPPAASSARVAVDPAIPAWEPAAAVSGTLVSVGSDSMHGLLTSWGDAFTKAHPDAALQVEGKGSSAAPTALREGGAQLAPMAWPMKNADVAAFEKKHGYEPTAVTVAWDALALYVHKDNPIDKLTLAQADALFGAARKQGAAKGLATWGDLGLKGDWAARPVVLYGRSPASDTFAVFKDRVLKNGDFKETVKEEPGSAAVVQALASDLYGLGYGSVADKTAGVKLVPLVAEDGHASAAAYDDVMKGSYPLARALLVYVNRAPGKPLDPVTHDFLKMVLSRQGQEVVSQAGALPLTAALVQQERAKLQ